ncbi:BACON domain-containing protein [Bacteroides sp. 224]|uniref:BACON domain-containing protein n=1 Tax=Bacteroides sp. 224 TaxID=2302936 RepID=UPI0013D05A53|nr:BACON domain-containing protein [Bacteroides sp. 224]
MKYFSQLLVTISFVLALTACEDDKDNIIFNIETDQFSINAEGGTKTIKIQSSGKWIASTEEPWVSFSPANGFGTVDCQIKVDSALTNKPRNAIVRFISEDQSEPQRLIITQNGYEKMMQLSVTEVEIPTYDELKKRKVEVELTTNVEFNIEIPQEANWVKVEDFDFELDRGARPRTVKLFFNWENNSRPWERIADIQFKPKGEEELSEQVSLKIIQEKAPKIEDNAQGDSLAIIACMRALGRSMGANEGELMSSWDFVTLWEADDKDVNPQDIGRVRSVTFMSFAGKEGIPYEIQHLTRAEEIIFYASESYLLGKFSTGPDLSKLTQLKRLQIYAFGLIELDPSFVALNNLEYLSLSGNNFSKVPDIITPENFPNLIHLDLAANRRWSMGDLTKPAGYIQNFGGQETWGGLLGEFPTRLLKWEKLEYLGLSNNFIYGTLPKMEDYPIRYTAEDLAQNDTLPDLLLDKPKILPNAKVLRINLNLLEGEIPEWILYHPNLWRWDPFTLVFKQDEGVLNLDGKVAGFTNVPTGWSYYYDAYPLRKPENID